jgi:hypothetical protein
MNGLKFVNFNDPHNRWSLKKICEITGLLKEYADKHDYRNVELLYVEDNTWSDEVNQRYDIEITYVGDSGPHWQKLLIMKGEVIDGLEFHKRYEEFYPENAARTGRIKQIDRKAE